MNIELPLFHISIQDFIDMKEPKNSAELYELLLKYESRHETDGGEVFVSPGQRGTHRNNSFSHKFRNKVIGKAFRREGGGGREFVSKNHIGYSNDIRNFRNGRNNTDNYR